VREVGILKKDPDVIKEQIEKLDLMSKFLSTNYLKIYLIWLPAVAQFISRVERNFVSFVFFWVKLTIVECIHVMLYLANMNV
jgi:hypothetical protein